MIGFNGLEGDTDFHARLSTESIKKRSWQYETERKYNKVENIETAQQV